MIAALAKRAAQSMQQRYNYDASYLREVAAVSAGGALRLGVLLPMLSGYRADAPVDLWAGAAIASTREGDCGPCLQLVIDMALEQGADGEAISAALQGNFTHAGDTGLGYRFACATIADSPTLGELRRAVRQQFSEQTLIALTITAATGRAWPVIKRGLGHGLACQAVTIDQQRVAL